MDIQSFKEKFQNGQISDVELDHLLNKIKTPAARAKSSNFMKSLGGAIFEGYTKPILIKTMVQFFIILVIVIGLIFLSMYNKIDSSVIVVVFSFLIGFLLGKFK